jgi:hypothetical protein
MMEARTLPFWEQEGRCECSKQAVIMWVRRQDEANKKASIILWLQDRRYEWSKKGNIIRASSYYCILQSYEGCSNVALWSKMLIMITSHELSKKMLLYSSSKHSWSKKAVIMEQDGRNDWSKKAVIIGARCQTFMKQESFHHGSKTAEMIEARKLSL